MVPGSARQAAGSTAAGRALDELRCSLALGAVRPQLVGNLANLVVALLLVGDAVPTAVLLGWAVALLATLVLRLALLVVGRRRAAEDPARVLRLLAAGSLFSGLVWAALALLVPPFEQFAGGPYLVALYAGITAGAGALNATHRPTLVAFLAPVLGGVAWRFASALHPAGLAVAGLVVLYGLLLMGVARRFERTFVDAHLLRLERENLLGELDRRAKELEATSERWRLAEARCRALADHAPVGIVRFDPRGRIVYANGVLEQSWRIDEDPAALRDLRAALAACVHGRERRELDVPTPGGVRHVVVESVRLPAEDGDDGDTILWIQDVTVLARTLAELEYLAHHDPLTGVANRKRFRKMLEERVAAARPGRKCALVLVDLDGFKPVNDRFGHAAGDAVLGEVARRLGQGLRAGDLVARLGGDEFALLVAGIEDDEQLTTVVQRVAGVFDRPVRFEGRELPVAASIGVALAPDHANEPNELLRAADSACYLAKERPGTAVRIYAPGGATVRIVCENRQRSCHRAVLHGDFGLRLRPWLGVSGRARTCVAVEAVSVAGAEVRTVELLEPPRGTADASALGERLVAALLDVASRLPPELSLLVPMSAATFHEGAITRVLERALRQAGIEERVRLVVEGGVRVDGPEPDGPAVEGGGPGARSLSWLAHASTGAAVEIAALAERGALGLVLAPRLCRRTGEAAWTALVHTVALARELGLLVAVAGLEDAGERARAERAGCDLVAGDAVAPLFAPDRVTEWLASLPVPEGGRETAPPAAAPRAEGSGRARPAAPRASRPSPAAGAALRPAPGTVDPAAGRAPAAPGGEAE